MVFLPASPERPICCELPMGSSLSTCRSIRFKKSPLHVVHRPQSVSKAPSLERTNPPSAPLLYANAGRRAYLSAIHYSFSVNSLLSKCFLTNQNCYQRYEVILSAESNCHRHMRAASGLNQFYQYDMSDAIRCQNPKFPMCVCARIFCVRMVISAHAAG